MMQQQFGHAVGPLGNKITALLNMFKQCGGKSDAYREAIAALPADAEPHLNAAIRHHQSTIQQQQQQLQM